jgi:hypothetical protein
MIGYYLRNLRFYVLLVPFLILCGCATYSFQYPPVTIDEITKLTKEKVPDDQIIEKIKKSRTAYRLSADDIVEMKKAGVDSKVIDYMLKTFEEAVREDQRMRDWNNWYFYNGYYYSSPYYYYPYRPFGWGVYSPPPYP